MDSKVAKIARAVLYEGYLLWPYRRSSLKNRGRWTFGGVFPEAYSRARGGDDRSEVRTECLLEGDAEASVEVRLAFLHAVRRRVARASAAGLAFVDELSVGAERYLAWDEATEREVVLPALSIAALLTTPQRQRIEIAAGEAEEAITDAAGRRAGALLRGWQALEGELEVRAEALGERLFRLAVRLANTAPWAAGDRDAATRHAFCSAHLVLRSTGGDFVSLTDPPAALAAAAGACRNEGVWPVLVGEEGERQTLLASPIILSDYPQVAPESPGDLFDGGEIDQLLILNVLSLTEAEQAEMRATDPKAREILERCAALSPEQLMRLHGAIRDFRPLAAE
jgi:hypothetical protein